ncbi:MAG TPA: pantoate--beta-alanine ligase, partial [Gammaproteobacteria bacterium]|nr:pantoate--beta-alanine ligase [Gammaproteobacteria bacterium]
MQIIETITALRQLTKQWRQNNERIALVPTMGNLHAGHLQLVTQARKQAEKVVTSIFVNPLQFGPDEDYARYPRTLDDDRQKLETAGCDAIFLPSVETLYPGGAANATMMHVPGLGDDLCGAHRPGHFDGVATVVARLLNAVQPDIAFFGEKDYQQLAVIRRMVADLLMPITIEGVATEREADGLAMSSRNQYLTASERAIAPRLYATLQATVADLNAGQRDYHTLQTAGFSALQKAGF